MHKSDGPRNAPSPGLQPRRPHHLVSDHPNSFEWCINAPAIDANGVVYANSEDGNLYAIDQGGTVKQALFLKLAVGAAYTPLAIRPDGLIYTENDGRMFVVGAGNRGAAHRAGASGTTKSAIRQISPEGDSDQSRHDEGAGSSPAPSRLRSGASRRERRGRWASQALGK